MKFGGIEKFAAGPPQPDPEAAMAAQLAATKLQAEIAHIIAKTEGERADVMLKKAQAIGEVAEAAAAESAAQVDEQIAGLERLQAFAKTLSEVANVRERIRGVDGPGQAVLPGYGTAQALGPGGFGGRA